MAILRGGLPEICRPTFLDRLALVSVAVFTFLTAAAAISTNFAIGEAPAERMWGFFGHWALLGFVVAVAGPWLVCRTLHAGVVFARIVLRGMDLEALGRRTPVEPSAIATVG